MKKAALLFMVIITVLSISCNKEYKFYGFDIEKPVTVQIPANTRDFNNEQTIDIKYEDILTEQGTTADLVQEITLEDITINENNYLKLDTVVFSISAEGKDKIFVATDSDSTYMTFNTAGFVYKIPAINKSVKEYVEKSKLNFFIDGSLLASETSAVNLNFIFRFRILTYVK